MYNAANGLDHIPEGQKEGGLAEVKVTQRC